MFLEWTQEPKAEEWDLRLCQGGSYQVFAVENTDFPEGGRSPSTSENLRGIQLSQSVANPVGAESAVKNREAFSEICVFYWSDLSVDKKCCISEKME